MYVGFEEFHSQGRRINMHSSPLATPCNLCLSHLQRYSYTNTLSFITTDQVHAWKYIRLFWDIITSYTFDASLHCK